MNHIDIIKRDCQPFLRATPEPLFRGLGRDVSGLDAFMKREVRLGRKARDNKQEFNDLVDRITEDHVGFKMRSDALFTISNYDDARQFGKVAMIFPIGEFSFVYSPLIKDLYHTFFGEGVDAWPDRLSELVAEQIQPCFNIQTVNKVFANLDGNTQRDLISNMIKVNLPEMFKTTRLLDGQLAGTEIMLSCPNGYYQVLECRIVGGYSEFMSKF